MLELLLCSLLTILPDYLYRRYVQGKRLGKEITFYSVWFELRWGITGCVILTVGLITVIFYNHPSTTSATLFFRTVPILPETNGRVAEIYVGTERVLSPRERRSSGSTARSRRPRWRPRAARSRRSRRRLSVAQAEIVEGGRPASRGQGQLTSRPWTSWRPSRSCTGATRATFRFARSRSSRSAWTAPMAAVAAATAAQAVGRTAGLDRAPGREGKCRSRAGSGPGGSGQDGHPRRRERARGAILPAGRRYRQSAHAPGREC